MFHKIGKLRAIHFKECVIGGLFSLFKFRIGAFKFFDTFNIRAKLICGFYNDFIFVRIVQDAVKFFSEVFGKVGKERADGIFFDSLIIFSHLLGKIFHRSGHISGIHLGRVVVEGGGNDFSGVIVFVEKAVADKRERVGDHCRLRAVLGKIFIVDVAHKSPSFNISLPENKGEKACIHFNILSDRLPYFIIKYSKREYFCQQNRESLLTKKALYVNILYIKYRKSTKHCKTR